MAIISLRVAEQGSHGGRARHCRTFHHKNSQHDEQLSRLRCTRRAAIERLRSDNALLKEEVMLENRFSVAPTSAAAAAAIAGLQEQSEVYNQKVPPQR